ncbi:ABC transporter substrate-binding protein [Streptomyces iconiensis]|uniref:ABC transporter substrate-binding protein n=1 Tax=Streptomyces iconiensis TaxID=1384038 RepID=A0ABT6ZPY8_9ACTN|nr:ABC transporter substrate-binding protein [Streptomyces iconiensis]MDJ1131117.1 ABC transporter substrate-binding protein [Streptomyces iconiensis]
MSARRVRTATAAGVTAAAVLAGVAACSAPGGGGGGGGGTDAVTVGVAQEPETLSPLLGYGKEGNSKIFDGLLTHDARMKLKPALATKLPEVSDDGKTYTFTLRDGVKFSDGKPFTAEDVVYTYRTILDKKTNNASKSELDALDTVKAKDRHGKETVVFTLKYPYAAFAERTVLPIASKAVAGRQDVNTGSYNTKPVGTGPYVLTNWRKGEKLSFKANPHYWGGRPTVKKFTVAIIEDDDVRATRLRSGDLDGAILPPNLAKAYKNSDEGAEKRTFSAKTADYRAVTLPTDNPVTGDKAVRRALDVAVDRDAMVKSILNGAGKPAYGPLPTDGPWFAKGTERPHDLARAKKILDKAGWKPGEDGIRKKDGKRASFTLWYFSGDKLRQDHALAYASDAKKAGIDVKVQAGSREVIRPKLKHDAMLMGNGFPADPDFDLYPTLHSSQIGDGWNNLGYYDDKTVDEQLDKGRRSRDTAERHAAYDKAQKALKKNPGYTFLTHIDHVYVLNDKWRGLTTQVEPHDHGIGAGPWWNVQDWKPKK